MTDDSDYKQRIRRFIIEQLALEALSGRSWKDALTGLKDIFEIDPAEIEREIAALDELRSLKTRPIADDENTPIDLRAQRLKREIETKGPSGSYGSGVRAQVFEVIVRQAMAGAQWRSICAGPMKINYITPEEVQAEVDRRQGMTGRDQPNPDEEEGKDPPESGGGGGRPKAPVPKNPFPFFGGAGKVLGLPGKRKGDRRSISGHDIKSHDSKSHGNPDNGPDNKSDDNTED